MKWDGEKKKQFRKALRKFYRNPVDLEMFVDEELDQNLADITTETDLCKIVFKLTQWAESKGYLDKLFEAFCRVNPDNPAVKELQRDFYLDDSFLTSIGSQEQQAELKELFSILGSGDDYLLDAQRAFLESFRRTKGNFQDYRPDCKKPNDFQEILKFLKVYYSSQLVVTFAERLIGEIQKTNQVRNSVCSYFEELKQWRDRFSQKYNVKPDDLFRNKSTEAYLLISILEQAGDVYVLAELQEDTENSQPIAININETQPGYQCEFDKCSEHLRELLKKAEEAVIGKEVTIEVFLRYHRWDENIATEWKFCDELGEYICLGNHRGFIVRSLDRVVTNDLKPQKVLQKRLKDNWMVLKKCIQERSFLKDLHTFKNDHPVNNNLRNLLDEKPGFKIEVPLPNDETERKNIFREIIIGAVPIALWIHNADCEPDEIWKEFDRILEGTDVTNFADFAKKIKAAKSSPKNHPFLNLRMLCDCPHRLPTIPTNEDPLTIPS
jgi:hypothetical protein